MPSPYWEVINPDALKSMRLNLEFSDWIKLNIPQKTAIRNHRNDILRRMKTSFTHAISSESICLSHDQFLAFGNEIKAAELREAGFEVQEAVHRLQRSPFVAFYVIGIFTTALVFWHGAHVENTWEIYFSPIAGLWVAWELFKIRQKTVKARYDRAVAQLEEISRR